MYWRSTREIFVALSAVRVMDWKKGPNSIAIVSSSDHSLLRTFRGRGKESSSSFSLLENKAQQWFQGWSHLPSPTLFLLPWCVLSHGVLLSITLSPPAAVAIHMPVALMVWSGPEGRKQQPWGKPSKDCSKYTVVLPDNSLSACNSLYFWYFQSQR